MHAFGQMSLDKAVDRIGHTYKIRRSESGKHRHSHHYRIDSRVKHTERHTQRRDDKRELAYLREGEARLHRYAKRLSCNKHPESAKQNHAGYHHSREQQYRPEVLDYDIKVDHHADRYEEYRAKQVLDRTHHSLD